MKPLISLVLFLFAFLPLEAAERDVTLRRDFGTLCGTLCVPESGSDAVVLLIAGSGPTDRNCNSPAGLYTNSFVYLAQALEKQGIATLRYDKRGIGASTYDDPEKIYDVTFDDYISDAEAWTAWLRGQGFRKVVLAGHSEGALIALCASVNGTETPDGIVSLAGPGFPIDQVLLTQLSAQLASTDISLLMQAAAVLNSLRQGKTVDDYPKELSMLFLPYLQRYLISQMKYDPQALIRSVHIPVLIVGGDNDLQISVQNAEVLKKAKPDAEMLLIPGMTHPLKHSEGHDIQSQMAVYMDATLPIEPALPEAIAHFVQMLRPASVHP